ncbi:hypothetical protein ACFW04_011286 [Cataglyphis niger]
MRQRWRPNKRLPPADGKRQPRREYNGRLPSAPHGVRYTPRPHLTLTLHGLPVNALLDSGSELSFINAETAERLRRRGVEPTVTEGQVRMADGTHTTTRGYVQAPLRLQGRAYTHTFAILPALQEDVLVGVDLWSRLGLNIAPPRREIRQTPHPSCGMAGSLTPSTAEESERLRAFLEHELPKFQAVTGPTPLAEHRIRLKNPTPIKQRYRPRNPAMQAIIDTEVDEMERAGVIEPSRSAWSSPIVVVRKKDGKHRFCIDFRRVNDVTEKDAYPLPQVTATLDKLRGAQYLTTLDLKNGYWQVPLARESRPITAFTVPGKGLMQFRVMPFGLHSAPATFQRLLDSVIGPALEPNVFVYLDDIIVISRTFERHLELLTEVFRRLRAARLRLNPEKCRFCVDQLRYLGHVVDRAGIHTDPEKVRAVASWEEPRSTKQIRQFLGVASWYRRFIENFSTIAAPLTRLTKKNARWIWGEAEATAFKRLKAALTTAPVLACPDFNRRFILQTDASTSGLGAVLTQYHEDGERVIAYASRTLSGAEANYSATELECLAVVWGVRRMRDYLEGYAFTVITDHQSLRWLQKLEAPTGRLARWLFELQQYDFEIKYRRGALNRVADALSRQPVVSAIQPIRCRWYTQKLEGTRRDPTAHPDYQVRGGELYRHILHTLDFKDHPTDEQWKLCIPRDRRNDILRQYHDAPTAGHGGVAKTIARIAERFYWPGMFRDIARYVRQCPGCLAHKPIQQKPAGTLHATNVSRPWEHVTVDLVGPLPRSRRGHTWLLVMQDRYSKWTELAPLRQASAKAVTHEITNRVILRHGRPDIVITDNGTQFKSAPLAARLKACQIEHRTAPVRAPHCNPVERTNRTIKTMIAQYVDRDHREWDEALNALQFAYNTAVHDATGYTPAFVNHGRELVPPTSAVPRNPAAPTPDVVQQRLQEAEEVVRINLARSFQRQERHYNLRRRQWRPQIGDLVWKREHPLSNKANAFNAKLAPKFIGPLEVRRMISPVIADLRSKSGKWYRHIHIQDLKPAPNVNNNKAKTTNDDSSNDEDAEEHNNISTVGSVQKRRTEAPTLKKIP